MKNLTVTLLIVLLLVGSVQALTSGARTGVRRGKKEVKASKLSKENMQAKKDVERIYKEVTFTEIVLMLIEQVRSNNLFSNPYILFLQSDFASYWAAEAKFLLPNIFSNAGTCRTNIFARLREISTWERKREKKILGKKLTEDEDMDWKRPLNG